MDKVLDDLTNEVVQIECHDKYFEIVILIIRHARCGNVN